MATISAQSIIDKAEILLQDTTNIRWSIDELLGWLNEGQREIVLLKPDSHAQNESVRLVSGTKQAIPATGTVLIDVVRNMGVSPGSTPGNVIRLTDRKWLDDQVPDWHAATAVAAVYHWIFDPRDPKNFYVYPPADGSHYAEIIYAKSPANVALPLSNVITLDDNYAPALLNYIVYRATSKDAEYTANAQKAMMARSEFLQLLGRQDLMEAIYNPNLTSQERKQALMAQPQG